MKVYIAFSIHGTNKFFVATRDLPNELREQRVVGINTKNADEGGFTVKDLPGYFTVTESRRPGASVKNDGVKLLWSELRNKKTGKPYIQRSAIARKFAQLRDEGWTLAGAAFKPAEMIPRQTTKRISLSQLS